MDDLDEDPVAFRRGNKYRASAKTLLPYRTSKSTGHPVDNAGFFSTVFYSWLTKLVWKLYRSPVALEKLWKTPETDKAVPNARRFLRLWEEEVANKKEKASMRRVMMRFLRTRIFFSAVCISLCAFTQFTSNGLIVRYLLLYTEQSEFNLKIGIFLIAGILTSELIRALSFSMSFAISMRNGIRLRSGITTAVFEKMMRVPPTETSSTGEIVNMCSSDGDRLFDATHLGHLLLTSPIMFFAATTYACTLVGPIALVGCALFILVMMVQVAMLKFLNNLRMQAVVFTDKRVKAINEIISSIKLIKMYGWEKSFTKVVSNIRVQERALLTRAMFFQSLNMSLAWLSPYLASILVLSSAIFLGNNITTSEAFTCFAMFHSMSFSLKVIPVALKNAAEAGVAADRVQKALERKEFANYVKASTSSPKIAIELRKGTLSWPTDEEAASDKADHANGYDDKFPEKQSKKMLENAEDAGNSDRPCLEEVNLEIDKGDLVGICGRVGCGKSSLISAVLGHLQLNDGEVAVNGSTAYCAQQAWIMNATIRDNITFGLPFVKEKYDGIVKACCLLPDFAILQSGDLTEVGERGVNMSGGQKQRINIARAIYMDRDIYLFDDPLSAVDAHVGKAIFENAVYKFLKEKGKTVVLVTHRLEYLPYCDQIIVIKNGKIWEIGSHDDLMDNGDDYYHLFRMWTKEQQAEDEADTSRITKIDNTVNDLKDSGIQSDVEKLQKGRLMTTEEKSKGSVSGETYITYIKCAGGWLGTFLCLLLFLVYVCCLQFSSFWLSYWMKQGSGNSTVYAFDKDSTSLPTTLNSSIVQNFSWLLESTAPTTESVTRSSVDIGDGRVIDNPDLYFYLSVFGYAIGATVVFMTLKALVFSCLCLKAAHGLHNKMFDAILHGTMEFFDTTPTGRILNRFQKDQDMLDSVIPLLLDFVISFSFVILTCVGFISYVFPYFLGGLAVIVPIFLVAFFLFKGAVTEMRRQDNITRSPWLSHITTTMTGIHTIRAYRRVKDFVSKFHELLDTNTVPFFLYVSINRWLVTRLDIMSMSVTVICTVLAVFTVGLLPASYAGLAITSALMLTVIFQFTVRTTVETEANFVAAERMVHYIKNVPQEPKLEVKQDLDCEWPQFGSVRFVNVNMRYREGLPLVLKDISFTINTRDKIGVVGRTGSGKSSLGVAIFRLVELVDGAIEIDGVNIAELSLNQLRSKIAIIPQEPVLFSGTVKYNVDPFNQFSEEDIWIALERTHMKEAISNLPEKLESPVSENGGNFSLGERQLLCLTRALLRRNKILVLDEATASIDAKTDKLVQDTINEHFSHCTLITIAHRLHTVLNCDKIMVLDRGNLVEFDTPDHLSKNPDSFFSKLLKSTQV